MGDALLLLFSERCLGASNFIVTDFKNMAPEALFFSLPILKLGHVRSTWHKLGWPVFLGVPPPPLEGSSALIFL